MANSVWTLGEFILSPLFDFGVVSRLKNLWDFEIHKERGSGVVWVLFFASERLGVGLFDGRLVLADEVRDEARDGVQDDEGGELAARQYILSNGEFLIDTEVDDALVDTFVATADKDEAGFLLGVFFTLGEFLGFFVGE